MGIGHNAKNVATTVKGVHTLATFQQRKPGLSYLPGIYRILLWYEFSRMVVVESFSWIQQNLFN